MNFLRVPFFSLISSLPSTLRFVLIVKKGIWLIENHPRTFFYIKPLWPYFSFVTSNSFLVLIHRSGFISSVLYNQKKSILIERWISEKKSFQWNAGSFFFTFLINYNSIYICHLLFNHIIRLKFDWKFVVVVAFVVVAIEWKWNKSINAEVCFEPTTPPPSTYDSRLPWIIWRQWWISYFHSYRFGTSFE